MYRDLESDIPLFLRPEAKDPQALYYNWLRIAPSESGSEIIYPMRKEAFNAYEQMVNTKLHEARNAIHWHWNSLSGEMRKREPHSPLNFSMAT